MLLIVEYLCNNSLQVPVTKNYIMSKIPGMGQQRSDRISHILSTLEQKGFIKSINTSSGSTFYQVTDKGTNAYFKWVKDYLDFARFAKETNRWAS